MNANKPIRERLLNIRLESMRLVGAVKARACLAAIDEDMEIAIAAKTAAKQARAAQIRGNEKLAKLGKVAFHNYRDGFIRSSVKSNKNQVESDFIGRSQRRLDEKLQGAADRLTTRDAAAKSMLLNEEALRSSLIKSCF